MLLELLINAFLLTTFRSTSLALEFLSMAVLPEWEHTLYIDVAVLNRLALWLTSQQNVTSGAFRSTKYIPDIRLMVGNNDCGCPQNSITAH